jgi:DNA transposition AAA+ family ATPase
MQQTLKTQIVTAAKQYMELHKLSQNDLAKQAGINQGYLSLMLKEQFTTIVNNKEVPIGDKWFAQLAEYIKYNLVVPVWKTVGTPQFVRIIDALVLSKATGRAAMVVGSTGAGKSYAVDAFLNKNPNHSYRITVSSLYRLRDIITELGELLGIEYAFSNKAKVDAVCKKLIDIKRTGGNPILIIDEGENMKMPVLHMVKALYDVLKNHCSIVIIGTEELLTKLIKMKTKGKDGMPQLYRRFKAGCVSLSDSQKFDAFYSQLGIDDKGLQKLLNSLCENYGELNDYLEPALKHAQQQGQPLTEELFRLMYNLPKYN